MVWVAQPVEFWSGVGPGVGVGAGVHFGSALVTGLFSRTARLTSSTPLALFSQPGARGMLQSHRLASRGTFLSWETMLTVRFPETRAKLSSMTVTSMEYCPATGKT